MTSSRERWEDRQIKGQAETSGRQRACKRGALHAIALLTLLAALLAAGDAAAAVVRVPADSPTIQGAIEGAAEGDTVLVSPGTYVERIDFGTKQVTVESAEGADTTTIDGGGIGVVVTMDAEPEETPVLRGFTVRNGGGDIPGGGIDTVGGPALIEHNIVAGQRFCDQGGIDAEFSSATIRANLVTDNAQATCSGGVGGAGISVVGSGEVKILANVISDNVSTQASGGGITLFAAGSPLVAGNVIEHNRAYGEGGAIWIVNHSDSVIENNVMTNNKAPEGGGVYWLTGSEVSQTLVNNTIVSNEAFAGSAVFADGYGQQARIVNNVLVGDGEGSVLACGSFGGSPPPAIAFNDVLNRGSGPEYGGNCTDLTGQNGNISADPLFADPAAGDFSLLPPSPGIDAGTNDGAPGADIDGTPRPQDGDGDGIPETDMGAYELGSPNAPPDCSGVGATPGVLRPANHKLRPVTLAGATDPDGDAVTLTIDSVRQDEPVTGRDSTSPDAAPGSRSDQVLLRAQRDPKRDGRVYQIAFSASDGNGGTCSGRATVLVPRSKRLGAIDSSPPSFDSFGPA